MLGDVLKMEFLKDVFGDNSLTYDDFAKAVEGKNIKLANLASGDYVSKQKYNDDITAKDTQINTLNDTIKTRDTDIATIKNQLKEAGVDKDKLTTLENDLTTLQGKYDTDTKAFKKQIENQAYEFAVKEFANSKKFTSNAAKRDFINSMIAKQLKIEDGKIIGADDFVNMYTKENADAFFAEEQKAPTPKAEKAPTFVGTTGGKTTPTDTNPFHFNFSGVRQKPDNK